VEQDATAALLTELAAPVVPTHLSTHRLVKES